MLAKDLGRLDERHLRGRGAVSPDLHDQAVVVGPLADAGLLDLVLDADDRRETGVHRNDADLALLAGVLVGGAVAATILDGHLNDERHVVGQRRDYVFRVNDLDVRVVLDIGRFDHALLVTVDADRSRLVRVVFYDQGLDVQDDVRDVLDDARDGADFVLDALDLDPADAAPLQAREEHAAQAVANGDAEPALERLGDELPVRVGEPAVGGDPARQFQVPPFDSHGTLQR